MAPLYRNVLCAVVGILVVYGSATAKVIYVSSDGSDLSSGLSWSLAKRTVTAALFIALPGDQIWVRYGVYEERITLKSGVALYGGFRGNESSLSERPAFPRPQPDPYETVLDGKQEGSVVTSPGTADQAFRLDGFTIRNGKAQYGGGLYLTSSATLLTVANCTIAYNSADRGGGVCCTNNSSPTLTHCIISANSSDHSDGGVCCSGNSSPTLIHCTICDNEGGGIGCSSSSSPTLTGCIISYNKGGGVRCFSGSSPTLSGCVISGNSGTDYGGGLFCLESSPLLNGCIISDNSADEFGGGVGCADASLTMVDCMIIHNSAQYGGGGVYCEYDAVATLTNCLLFGNSAEFAGGVGCDYASLALTNCTVALNSASDIGGIAVVGEDVNISNTIFASNVGGGIWTSGVPTFRHNCVWNNIPYNFAGDIGNPIGTNGNISVDPLLMAGHLLPGSPCINAGDNSVVSVDVDYDGEPRIADGTVDIGADEFHPPIVQGYLLFNDFGGRLPPMIEWEIRRSGTEVRTLPVDADGAFVVPRVAVGQFVLSVKPLTYLRRTVEVDTSGGNVLDMAISLVNGDIDDDNEVTLFDFGALVAAFGTIPGDERWNPRADLDGDGEVTLFDFGILVRNFGEVGDE